MVRIRLGARAGRVVAVSTRAEHDEAVQSWLDVEQQILEMFSHRRGLMAAKDFHRLRVGSRADQAKATRRLREMLDGHMRESKSNGSTYYPPPPVTPDLWDWGIPGSFDDWLLLDGV